MFHNLLQPHAGHAIPSIMRPFTPVLAGSSVFRSLFLDGLFDDDPTCGVSAWGGISRALMAFCSQCVSRNVKLEIGCYSRYCTLPLNCPYLTPSTVGACKIRNVVVSCTPLSCLFFASLPRTPRTQQVLRAQPGDGENLRPDVAQAMEEMEKEAK